VAAAESTETVEVQTDMQESTTDPRCPECGEPIGQRATYCMHCSADLTNYREAMATDLATDPDGPGGIESRWFDNLAQRIKTTVGHRRESPPTEDEQLLDPDGLVDDTLTVVVGIAGGGLIAIFATTVLIAMTGSGWALLVGVIAWLGSTAYLVRRRTVQGAIAVGGYGVALVLLLVPLLAFSPVTDVEGGLAERGSIFLVLGVFVVVPVIIATAVGWTASQYAPRGEDGGST
jgi:hypothetical protein